MNKEREYSFDILRVIAMILVITVHVSNIYSRSFGLINANSYLWSLIYNTIARVSVPIFFMISGALLLDRKFNFKKYYKRILKFIILIVVWDIIYLVWEYFYLGITYNHLYKLLFTPYRAHLWFLYTIIILYLLQPLLRLILNKCNKYIKIILFLLWILFSTLSMFNHLISSIFTIFNYIGYFIIGKYLYDYLKNNDLKKYNIIMLILLVLSFTGSIYLNYIASARFNYFHNLFFAYRTPYIILCSFIVFVLMYNLFHNKTPNKIILKLSELSLGVYLIHGIFLDITNKVFFYTDLNANIGVPIFVLIIFILSIISVYLLRKIKLLKNIL